MLNVRILVKYLYCIEEGGRKFIKPIGTPWNGRLLLAQCDYSPSSRKQTFRRFRKITPRYYPSSRDHGTLVQYIRRYFSLSHKSLLTLLAKNHIAQQRRPLHRCHMVFRQINPSYNTTKLKAGIICYQF